MTDWQEEPFILNVDPVFSEPSNRPQTLCSSLQDSKDYIFAFLANSVSFEQYLISEMGHP